MSIYKNSLICDCGQKIKFFWLVPDYIVDSIPDKKEYKQVVFSKDANGDLSTSIKCENCKKWNRVVIKGE